VIKVPISNETPRLTEFGVQIDRLISKLKGHTTIADYAELTGLSYKYIYQLRTNSDRKPGSYAIVKLLEPFVNADILTLNEAMQFSIATRGKILTFGECKDLFPGANEDILHQTINQALQSDDRAASELIEIAIIENDYCVPLPIIEFIKRENPQVVKMIDFSAQYGRNYINALRTLDPNIKTIQLLIHNPLVEPVSGLQKMRTCEQIRTLKLIDFKNDVLKIKCYNRQASLRGGKFDNELIMLGWYTFYYDPNYPEYGKNQIWGHVNPLIISRLRNQGKCLGEMFDRVFDSLWNDTGSTSLLDVCTRQCKLYKAGSKSALSQQGCPVSEDWLIKVSS
jgi:hypothetical protein